MPPDEGLLAHAWRGIRAVGLSNTLQSALYPLRRAFHEGSFAGGRSSPSLLQGLTAVFGRRAASTPTRPEDLAGWNTPGAVLSTERAGRVVTLHCERASVQITVLAADLFLVRYSTIGAFEEPFSYAVAKPAHDWPPVGLELEELPGAVEIRSGQVTCRVMCSPCRISFLDRNGTLLHGDRQGMAWHGERAALSTELLPGQRVYGLGERALGLDLRGQRVTLWNVDPQNYQPGSDPLYLNIPFCLELAAGRASGVFYDNTCRAVLDLGATRQDEQTYLADGGELRYYFLHGPSLANVLSRYTELTGRTPLPPLWALGYQQSRWSYYPASRVREIATTMREHRIPCDALYLDIHYMDGYRSFTWDRQRFPDPAGLLSDLHALGLRVVAVVDPGIKADPGYRVCAEGLDQHLFCTYPDGKVAGGPVWPGESYFPDFTAERARRWWGDLYAGLLADGVDGIWNDMNEPTVIGPSGDSLAGCVRHGSNGRGADHRQAHNVYGLLTARATFEGLSRLRPNLRPFVLTRSGWAGVQPYATSWTGDNKSTWDHLRLSIAMVLGKGLSGLAFTGADVGGFDGDADGELLLRWTQLGAFLPLFRNHCSIWSRDQEPWAFGEPYLSHIRRAIELRYRLLPYLYTALWQCSTTGAPLARPLAWDFPSDESALQAEDEFLCGDSLLVAPVVEQGATARTVYLPSGAWYDWWSGARRSGPERITVEAPLERIPLWVKAGAVVPLWPLRQHTGGPPPDRITLDVYAGEGHSVLYEDDGLTLGYRNGDSRVTEFDQRLADGALHLDVRQHGVFVPGYQRIEWRVHGLAWPAAVQVDDQPLSDWEWLDDGAVLRFETGDAPHRMVIAAPTRAA